MSRIREATTTRYSLAPDGVNCRIMIQKTGHHEHVKKELSMLIQNVRTWASAGAGSWTGTWARAWASAGAGAGTWAWAGAAARA